MTTPHERVVEAARRVADDARWNCPHCCAGNVGEADEHNDPDCPYFALRSALSALPAAGGECPPCVCDIDATDHDKSCPRNTDNVPGHGAKEAR